MVGCMLDVFSCFLRLQSSDAYLELCKKKPIFFMNENLSVILILKVADATGEPMNIS